MKHLLVLLAIGLVVSSHLQADIVLLPEAISVKEDIPKFNYRFVEESMENPKRHFMQCVELKDLEGALLCATGKRAYMNQALSRVSLFSEGNAANEKGTVFELDSKEVTEKTVAFGFNIPSSEIMGFWGTLAKRCQAVESCTSKEELELFEKVILPMSFKKPRFILITYAIDSDWYAALSHELMHAQYFLDSRFSQTVDRFWNETLTPEDRERIRQTLGEFYNRNDEAVMRNEFQAFLLGTHAAQQMLADFIPRYQEKLIQKLKEAGVELMRAN